MAYGLAYLNEGVDANGLADMGSVIDDLAGNKVGVADGDMGNG